MRPYNVIVVHRADDVGDFENVPTLRIVAVEPFKPGHPTPEFEADAEKIVTALFQTLPGGTLDQILVKLLLRKTSAHRVSHLHFEKE